MRTVALANLQNQLSEYVHLAQEGETVLVTERDRVIARLVPPLKEWRQTLEAAVSLGWITLPRHGEHTGPPPRSPVGSWGELARDLEEDRSERVPWMLSTSLPRFSSGHTMKR
jgi:antitoxin (DNA-binding transcriptional repressor) of toxin-antitoxin stability system